MTNRTALDDIYESLGIHARELGIVIVDHGSRREASNDALLDVVALFQAATAYSLVEHAHMELAEPSITTAFGRLVAAGAKFIIVHPYFLLPGRHWAQDIPQLSAAASKLHGGVRYLVTAPLGIHPLMANIMDDRIQHCLRHVAAGAAPCQFCDELGKCRAGLIDEAAREA